MIIVPEIKTVVLLVPRTGTGALRRALKERYPRSAMIYRHMEADGIPHGYDRWRTVGVIREPAARLWSLYKFCRGDGLRSNYPAFAERQKRSAFSDWVVNNDLVFTDLYDSAGGLAYWPEYTVLHALPENRKSQFIYLRPDLGTQVYPFERYDDLCRELNVTPERTNVSEVANCPILTDGAREHIKRFFEWDLAEHKRLASLSEAA